MPKNKKGKKKQTTIEDEDWNSASDQEIDNKPMNKAKKGKKGKKGGNNMDAPMDEADLAAIEAEIAQLEAEMGGPPPELDTGNKNKKKKNKKKKKGAAFDDMDSSTKDESQDVVEDTQPAQGKKNKKKKGKKGKKGGDGATEELDFEAMEAEIAQLEAEAAMAQDNQASQPSQGGGGGGGKGKKAKKGKKGKNNQKRLEAKKTERQEELMEHYKELIEDLDRKYEAFFTEEFQELFEDSLTSLVTWYDSNIDKVDDDEVFESKMKEMDNTWEELLELMREQWKEANAESIEEKKKAERDRKIKELEAAGMRVGRSDGVKHSQMSEKQRRKKEEKERLKAMKAKLKELDKQQKEKEMREEKEKELELQKKKQAEEQAKKEKEAALAKKSVEEDDWDSDSSDGSGGGKSNDSNDDWSSDEDKSPKKKTNNNNNKNKNNKNNNKQQKGGKGNNKQKQQQQQSQGGKKKKAPIKFNDSDSEPEYKPNKKKRRKKKGKGGASGGTSTAASNGTSQDTSETSAAPSNGKAGKAGKGGKKDSKVQPDVDTEEKIPENGKVKKDKSKKKPLRSPICVVMGHVNSGKTLILDKIRHSSVQHGEAGGITQQIGATYLSIEYIKKECERMKEQIAKQKYKVPGLLFIDTPGHESFSNLRERGSSMCDIAILVIDIKDGIQQTTVESLEMLKRQNIPFIVAVNKIDICIDWKVDNGAPFQTTYKNQEKHTKNDFEKRLSQTQLDFSNHGWNTALYFKNKNLDTDISLVPTSAQTGEGIPDLMFVLTKLTQKFMTKKLTKTKFKCNVLEVKNVQGYGATIDVIISGGHLEADDTIIVCGMVEPIVTRVKALLLPHEAQEMRVKGDYQRVAEVHASAGVRIAGHDSLEGAVAGSQLEILDRKYKDANKFKRERKKEIDRLCEKVQSTFNNLKSLISKTGRGVYVQASTLGALEALIVFLQGVNVPICGFNIGNVHKSDVMKASIQKQYQPEYCLILAFNVHVVPDARQMAQEYGVQIFEEEIIYQLNERFKEYIDNIRNAKKNQAKDTAVFPVEMQILSPEHVFNNKNPIVIGVEITRGTLRIGTPIVVKLYKDIMGVGGQRKLGQPLFLGQVTSIQSDKKDKPHAKQGEKVAIRIEGDDSVKNVQVGRSFELKDKLISRISRNSLDALKQHFGDELEQDDVNHLGQLKKYFEII